MKAGLAIAVVLLGCAVFASNSTAYAQDSGDLCATAGNLTVNCGFNTFKSFYNGTFGGRVGTGWNAFVISGRPDFTDAGCDSPDCPAQRIWSDGETWDAGIYQQVNVTAGQGYRAEIGWFSPRCPQAGTNGRIGIDPLGGVDPRSPNIVWSNYNQLQKSLHHRISAAARAQTVTVFVEAVIGANCTQRESNGTLIVGNITWLDAVILVPDNSVAPAPTLAPTVPPPTATPAPTSTPLVPPTATRPTATRTSTPLPPTSTPQPTVTSSPTGTPTDVTAAIAVSIDTPAPASSATSDAASTTAPAATRRPAATSTDAVALAGDSVELSAPSVMMAGLIGASGCAMLFSLLLAVTAVWLWRRR